MHLLVKSTKKRGTLSGKSVRSFFVVSHSRHTSAVSIEDTADHSSRVGFRTNANTDWSVLAAVREPMLTATLCHPESALAASNNEEYFGSALCYATSHNKCAMQIEPGQLSIAWPTIFSSHAARACKSMLCLKSSTLPQELSRVSLGLPRSNYNEGTTHLIGGTGRCSHPLLCFGPSQGADSQRGKFADMQALTCSFSSLRLSPGRPQQVCVRRVAPLPASFRIS